MSKSDHRVEFLLAEYAAVREEVKWIISQTEAVENLALATSGGIWAWVLTRKWSQFHFAVVWLPLVVSLLFYVKRRALRNSLETVRNYILRIEASMGLPAYLNYKNYLKYEIKEVAHFKNWRLLFWLFLVVGNAAALAIALILRYGSVLFLPGEH